MEFITGNTGDPARLFERSVYVTKDRGRKWTQIAREGMTL